jgi:hypothetical protein
VAACLRNVGLQELRYSPITACAFRINLRSERAMAIWVLICKRCGETFAYSEIGESFLDYFFRKKPKMPVEGVSVSARPARPNLFTSNTN